MLCVIEAELKKVLVTLDSCPMNATKNSTLRIYSPWLTIKSEILEIPIYIGVVHAEVVELAGPTRPIGPTGLFDNLKGLLTNAYNSEVIWKCSCSKGIVNTYCTYVTYI